MRRSKTLYSSESVALVQWLKEQRYQSNHTIRSLAKELGWASSIVGKIEQGERRLDVVEFILYCQALGVNPEEGIKMLSTLNSTKK